MLISTYTHTYIILIYNTCQLATKAGCIVNRKPIMLVKIRKILASNFAVNIFRINYQSFHANQVYCKLYLFPQQSSLRYGNRHVLTFYQQTVIGLR